MGWARTTVLSDSYGESLHLSPRARVGVQASCDLDVELHVLEQYAIYVLALGRVPRQYVPLEAVVNRHSHLCRSREQLTHFT
jgi:hypothetical protein